MIRRRPVNNEMEEKILTGLIVSDRVCRDTHRLIKKDTFKNPYAYKIAKWVVDYYRRYQVSPNQLIQDIYNTEKETLKEEEAEFISGFLDKLSSRFEKEEKFNEDFLIDEAIKYFKKRALKNISEKMESFLELDNLDDAEKTLQSYQQVSKETSRFINPFSDKEIIKYYEDELSSVNEMFAMPGELGDLVGVFERGTVVGVGSPAKRGKSFFLMEAAIQALTNNYKVLFVSLEMNEFKMKRRLLRRVTARTKEAKDFVFPCVDCFKNQMDICTKRNRVGLGRLRDREGKKPDRFNPSLRYSVCTACRGTEDFTPDTWFTVVPKKKSTITHMRKVGKGLEQMYNSNFRLVCYPKFSANIARIKSDIELLEEIEGFVPDVIVIDYADILAPEDSRLTGRDRYDDTWKMLGNLADTRKVLLFTATQTNRKSFDKRNVTETDTSEDIRKVAHADLMLTLSQTTLEKIQGLVRIAVVAGRDEEFINTRHCVVLQNLSLAQAYLDSVIIDDVLSQESNERRSLEF